MLREILIRLDERRADRKLNRYNRKLEKLLNKRLCNYQTTIWAFVRAERAFDNCETLKDIIRIAEERNINW